MPQRPTTAWLALSLALAAPAEAAAGDSCSAPATWIERTVCGSEELTVLDAEIARSETALVAAADRRFASALAAGAAAWQASRDGCRKAEYPQACMERHHYRRLDTLAHLAGLLIGPRRFGDPVRGCLPVSETADQLQACLDARLTDSRDGLAIAASGVRAALAERDRAPDTAGDPLVLFDAAAAAFAAHEAETCAAKAGAIATGRARDLEAAACRIGLVRQRAADLLKLMPGLAVPWTAGIAASRDAIAACLARTGPGAVIGIAARDGTLSIRIDTADGDRQDCGHGRGNATSPTVSPVAEADIAAGEGLARFLPGAGPVRPPACGLAEPVRDPTGDTIGHLVVSGC